MNIFPLVATYAPKHLFGTSDGQEPSPEPSPEPSSEPSSELRLAAAAKSFDVVLLGLSALVDEMLKQKAEVKAKTLDLIAGLISPNHKELVTALELAEDKLVYLVNLIDRWLTDLRDHAVSGTAEHTYQSLVFADWGAEANALNRAARKQLAVHKKEFTDKLAQVRFGKNIALPDDRFLEEQIRLLREKAKFQRSGMTYSTEVAEATSISRNLMRIDPNVYPW